MQSLLQYRRAATAAQAHIKSQTLSSNYTSSRPSGEQTVTEQAEFSPQTSDELAFYHQTVSQTCAVCTASEPNETSKIVIRDFATGTSGSSIARSPEPDAFTKELEQSDKIYIIGWSGSDDSLDPRNWSTPKRLGVLLQLSLVTLVLTAASSIDSVVIPQAAHTLHVSEVAESLATGMLQ